MREPQEENLNLGIYLKLPGEGGENGYDPSFPTRRREVRGRCKGGALHYKVNHQKKNLATVVISQRGGGKSRHAAVYHSSLSRARRQKKKKEEKVGEGGLVKGSLSRLWGKGGIVSESRGGRSRFL